MLARAFRWGYSYERLELAEFLGQPGVFRTCLPSTWTAVRAQRRHHRPRPSATTPHPASAAPQPSHLASSAALSWSLPPAKNWTADPALALRLPTAPGWAFAQPMHQRSVSFPSAPGD